MVTKKPVMLGLGCSLVEQFDDIVACSGVLNAGIEGGKLSDSAFILRLNLYIVPDFARFVGHQAVLHAMLCSECDEKKRMKSDKEAVEIKLKHARYVCVCVCVCVYCTISHCSTRPFRNTIDFQIKRRNEAEDIVKQYVRTVCVSDGVVCERCVLTCQEKQFTIIKELLNTENRMGILNDEEKKSLMFLKENNRRSSQGTA